LADDLVLTHLRLLRHDATDLEFDAGEIEAM